MSLLFTKAVMQVAHIILTDFKYEQDAFDRARQGFHEQFDSIVKGLESACIESLTYSLTGGDGRYCHLSFLSRETILSPFTLHMHWRK